MSKKNTDYHIRLRRIKTQSFVRYFTYGDVLLIIILLTISLVSFLRGQIKDKDSVDEFLITHSSGSLHVPTTKDTVLEISGPLGKTIIKIENRSARVLASPCPEKVCIRMGQVRQGSEIVVCAPNRVLITANRKPQTEREYDAITR